MSERDWRDVVSVRIPELKRHLDLVSNEMPQD